MVIGGEMIGVGLLRVTEGWTHHWNPEGRLAGGVRSCLLQRANPPQQGEGRGVNPAMGLWPATTNPL